MPAIVIRVVAPAAKVLAQPVRPVAVTTGDGARVLVVAKPGPQGPPGAPGEGVDLAPEERQTLLDDAETQVLEDLVPPVTLTLLFQNGLA